jgi:hypothetical protein
MTAERELLVRCRAAINIRYDQVMLIRLHHEVETLLGEVEELLDQPEQKPEPLLAETKIEWYGKGFRQGVNEFAPPKPLTEDVIYALDKEGVVENMDDHQVRYVIRWIRRVEKAHGIGGE